MAELVISFHNHLPAATTWYWRRHSVRWVRRLIAKAIRSEIDILCINQWATLPEPFFLFDNLVGEGLDDEYEVQDWGTCLTVQRSDRCLIVVKGLELGVVTEDGLRGEVVVLGVETDFPTTIGRELGFGASDGQKQGLWRSLQEYRQTREPWLVVVPHPCYSGSFGSMTTARLLKEGVVDTFESFNSTLALVRPDSNHQATEVGRCLLGPESHFEGITGNDGIDVATALKSQTRVHLGRVPSDPADLLTVLAQRIRSGRVANVRRRSSVASCALKALHSGRKWHRLTSLRRRIWKADAKPSVAKEDSLR